jgi:hypothetical protein
VLAQHEVAPGNGQRTREVENWGSVANANHVVCGVNSGDIDKKLMTKGDALREMD